MYFLFQLYSLTSLMLPATKFLALHRTWFYTIHLKSGEIEIVFCKHLEGSTLDNLFVIQKQKQNEFRLLIQESFMFYLTDYLLFLVFFFYINRQLQINF